MEILFIVINDETVLDELIEEFESRGFRGGTLLESQGMAHSYLTHSGGEIGHSYLKNLFNNERPFNKTLFMIVEKDRVEDAKKCVREVSGGLNKENVGIMFTFPISSVEGLTK